MLALGFLIFPQGFFLSLPGIIVFFGFSHWDNFRPEITIYYYRAKWAHPAPKLSRAWRRNGKNLRGDGGKYGHGCLMGMILISLWHAWQAIILGAVIDSKIRFGISSWWSSLLEIWILIAGVKNDADDDDDHDRVRIAVARATLNDFAWDVMIIMKTDYDNNENWLCEHNDCWTWWACPRVYHTQTCSSTAMRWHSWRRCLDGSGGKALARPIWTDHITHTNLLPMSYYPIDKCESLNSNTAECSLSVWICRSRDLHRIHELTFLKLTGTFVSAQRHFHRFCSTWDYTNRDISLQCKRTPERAANMGLHK